MKHARAGGGCDRWSQARTWPLMRVRQSVTAFARADAHNPRMTRSTSALLKTLCAVRWLAVVGQSAAIVVATGPLHLALNPFALWSGIAVLSGFNLFAMWRTARLDEPSAAEAFLHIAVDVVVLTWLIAWSGGIANPFTSLFLLPIAFAALALTVPWVYAMAALCGAGYAASILLGQPLPHMHGVSAGFDLHLWGMVVNFLVSSFALLYFFTRMSAILRRREDEISMLRERFARNEGIVALATHAASVAHELNTPLGTMTLILDDLLEEQLPQPVTEDHRALRALVDVCRDRVKELAMPAAATIEGATSRIDIDRVIERWQLVRPAVELARRGTLPDGTHVDAAVGHLLQALLNNAADAGEANGIARVDVKLDSHEGFLLGEIRDYGAGFEQAVPFLPVKLFESSKPHGLGIGLALSHATVERLNGELTAHETDGQGIRVRFKLPLSSVSGA